MERAEKSGTPAGYLADSLDIECPPSPLYYRLSSQLVTFIGNDGTPKHQGLVQFSVLVTGGVRGR